MDKKGGLKLEASTEKADPAPMTEADARQFREVGMLEGERDHFSSIIIQYHEIIMTNHN